MNIQSYQALSSGLQSMQDALLKQKMMERQQKQEALENQLKEAMFEHQKQRASADDAYRTGRATAEDLRFDRGFNFQKERAGADDTYRTGRATAEDLRFDRGFTFQKERAGVDDAYRTGRATAEDLRFDRGFKLQEMEAKLREAERKDVTARQVDEDGTIYTRKIPLEQFNARQPTSAGQPNPNTPPLSGADLQALQWARANPKDPRAAAILKKLGQ